MIDEIARDIPFRTYRTVRELLPGAPREWLDLPAEIEVQISISEGVSIGRETFDEFRRDSLEEALHLLYGGRHPGLLLHYTVAARGVVPLLGWDADWPLLRRGRDAPSRRDKVQGDVPWEYDSDPSLFSVFQHVQDVGLLQAPCYWAEPVVRLRAGGRSPEEAIANWQTCAQALRSMKRAIETDGRGR